MWNHIHPATDKSTHGRLHHLTLFLQSLYKLTESEVLTPGLINLHLQESGVAELENPEVPGDISSEVTVQTKRGIIRGRGPNQKRYLDIAP